MSRFGPRVSGTLIAMLAACAFVLLAGALDSIAAQRKRAHLIGVVLPRDASPGDRISASAVSDLEGLKDVPALRVIPLDTGAGVTLNEIRIDLGDGRKQPADGAMVVVIPRDVDKIHLSLVKEGRTIAEKQVTPAERGVLSSSASRLSSSTSHPEFTMPSICPVDRVQAIRGPFAGDSTQTSIEVSQRHARILAESPRAAYFELPDDVSPGTRQIKLREGGRTVSFEVDLVGIQLAADKLALHAGEDTNFAAQVTGIKSGMKVWRGSTPADLFDLADTSTAVAAPALGGVPGSRLRRKRRAADRALRRRDHLLRQNRRRQDQAQALHLLD